jgi:hypothetical protein
MMNKLFNKSTDAEPGRDFKFKLGHVVRDQITGFEGVIVCRSQWLTNCNTYGVKPQKLKDDGTPMSTEHFDEPNLIEVEPEPRFEEERDTGGPTSMPPRTNLLS